MEYTLLGIITISVSITADRTIQAGLAFTAYYILYMCVHSIYPRVSSLHLHCVLSSSRLYLVHLITCGCPKAVGWQGGPCGNALQAQTALVLEQPCASISTAGLFEAVCLPNVAFRCIASCRQGLHESTMYHLTMPISSRQARSTLQHMGQRHKIASDPAPQLPLIDSSFDGAVSDDDCK